MANQGTTVVGLLRHGEPEGGPRYRGSTDDPLTANGWMQMWMAVGTEFHWDRIVTSPLARCLDFARELSRRRSLPLEVNDDLRELHFGAWEGWTVAELVVEHTEALTRFWQDPLHHPPPGAEPLPELQARILAAWKSVLALYPREHILLITHSGPVRVLLGHLMGRPLKRSLEIEVKYASLHLLCVDAHEDGGMEAQAIDLASP